MPSLRGEHTLGQHRRAKRTGCADCYPASSVLPAEDGTVADKIDTAPVVPPETREAWMLAGVAAMRPWFEAIGVEVPPVRVSVGWPHGRGSARHALGQCFSAALVEDGVPNLFVTPSQHEPAEVLETLGHEMIHAAGYHQHRGKFASTARQLGYANSGKTKTSRSESPDLYARLDVIADKLGPFPHARVNSTTGQAALRVQSTRMLKVECSECGCALRMTRKWLDEAGVPTCGCGGQMREVA